jgi:hypothetical protein
MAQAIKARMDQSPIPPSILGYDYKGFFREDCDTSDTRRFNRGAPTEADASPALIASDKRSSLRARHSMSRLFPERFHTAVRKSSSLAALILLCLFVLILGVRLSFPEPITEPDSDYYSQLGHNLVTYHCYGRVNGETGACSPVWGNQPPGYPIFLGALQALGFQDLNYAVFIQTALFAIVATYALWAAYAWHKSLATLVISGAVLALSPVTIAWPRWVLTETLAGAGTLWVFAEIFRSLALQRLRILQLSLAASAAILVRWDQIWLLVPAAGCALYLDYRKPLNVCRQIGIMGFVAGLSIFVMVLRAAIVGLPLFPSVANDTYLPKGVMDFWRVAAKNQSFTATFVWPITDQKYKHMAKHFDYSSIAPGLDTPRFRAVLHQISALPSHTALPEKLDADLAELARNPSPKAWSRLHLVAQRAMAIWTQWDDVYKSGWEDVNDPNRAENFARAYRTALLIITAALLFFLRGERLFILGALISYVAVRTCFLASLSLLESRFLVPMLPSMELVLIAAIPTSLRASDAWAKAAGSTFAVPGNLPPIGEA